jgi:hypothetical protein
MIVIAGWVSLWYSRQPHDAFVAFVCKATLWLCHGSPCCIRRMLVSWALWCFTMMALIASIAISDGFDHAHHDWWWHCCLLSLVAPVPSSVACIWFTARIFHSLITIQTELLLDYFLLFLLLYQAIDQSIWSGCVICCWLVQPIVANETFLHTIFVDNYQAHGLFEVQAKVFDRAINIEDKAFRSMLESLPLHGGLLCNACYARIVDLKFVTFRCHGVSEMVWLFSSWSSHICVRYNWLLCASFLHIIFSCSTQVKAVITVCCRIKGNENN